jgi:flagellar hook-length control protein FliK
VRHGLEKLQVKDTKTAPETPAANIKGKNKTDTATPKVMSQPETAAKVRSAPGQPEAKSTLEQPVTKLAQTLAGESGKNPVQPTTLKETKSSVLKPAATKTRVTKGEGKGQGKQVSTANTALTPNNGQAELKPQAQPPAASATEPTLEEIVAGGKPKGGIHHQNHTTANQTNGGKQTKPLAAEIGEPAPTITATDRPTGITPPKSAQSNLPQPLYQQIFDGIRQAYILKPKSVTLKIVPEELGEVRIRVAIEGDQLVAKIHTENQQVASILRDSQSDLEQRLREQGIDLERLEVRHKDGHEDPDSGARGNGNQRDRLDEHGHVRNGQQANGDGKATEKERATTEPAGSIIEQGRPFSFTV